MRFGAAAEREWAENGDVGVSDIESVGFGAGCDAAAAAIAAGEGVEDIEGGGVKDELVVVRERGGVDRVHCSPGSVDLSKQ